MTTVLWRFFLFSLLILSILVLYIGSIWTGLNLYADKLDAKAEVLRRECIVRTNQKRFGKLWYLTLHPNSDYKKDDLNLIEGDTLNNLGTVSPAIIDQWAREYEDENFALEKIKEIRALNNRANSLRYALIR